MRAAPSQLVVILRILWCISRLLRPKQPLHILLLLLLLLLLLALIQFNVLILVFIILEVLMSGKFTV